MAVHRIELDAKHQHYLEQLALKHKMPVDKLSKQLLEKAIIQADPIFRNAGDWKKIRYNEHLKNIWRVPLK